MIMSISGIYSITNEVINSTENSLSTGYVDIAIEKETITENVVMSGETISLDTRIKNLGVDAYVRVKAEYTFENNTYELDSININNALWTKVDDYYYYNSILNKDSSLLVFNTFVVPDNITIGDDNEDFTVNVTADAVQAKNVTQDLDSSSPWNDIIISKRVEKSYSSDDMGSSTVIYENGIDKYLSIRDGFFDNLAFMLPGDSLSEEIDINNTGGNEVGLYFKTSFDGIDESEKRLLQSINLVIKDEDNNTLYDGPMLTDKKLLKSYKDGEQDKLTLSVILPSDLDNEFSTIVTKIIWNFSCEEYNNGVPVNPRTGEHELDMSIKVFIISFICLVIVLILAKINSLNRNKEKIRKKV